MIKPLSLVFLMDIRLKTLEGTEKYMPIIEVNPETTAKTDLAEDDIVAIEGFEDSFPLIMKFRSACPPDSAILSPSIMYRMGLMDGETVNIKRIDNKYSYSFVKLRVLGEYKGWLENRRKLLGLPVGLDENILISDKTSVTVMDLDPIKGEGIGFISHETQVYTQYSGLYNYIIIVDQSKHMLGEWRGVKKYRIAQRYFKARGLYKIRRASKLSVLTVSEEPMIYINWMTLQMDLRMMFQTILSRIMDNIMPMEEYVDVDYIELLRFLEKHLEGMDDRYPPLITIVSGKEFDYSEKNAAMEMLKRLVNKFGPYLKIVGIPIGPTYGGRFETLRSLTEATGGIFVEARSPRGLLRKISSISYILDLPLEKAGDWV